MTVLSEGQKEVGGEQGLQLNADLKIKISPTTKKKTTILSLLAKQNNLCTFTIAVLTFVDSLCGSLPL